MRRVPESANKPLSHARYTYLLCTIRLDDVVFGDIENIKRDIYGNNLFNYQSAKSFTKAALRVSIAYKCSLLTQLKYSITLIKR